uniref:Uncharacterized protein n=1 Tax=Arundo donax TaxID=35708 RepID=A0A0A9BE19_ARUDO
MCCVVFFCCLGLTVHLTLIMFTITFEIRLIRFCAFIALNHHCPFEFSI